jgi:hypothetical protein
MQILVGRLGCSAEQFSRMCGFLGCASTAKDEYMPQHDQSNPPPKLDKTEARQGRVVADGRIARILMTSLAALVVVGILLFLVY